MRLQTLALSGNAMWSSERLRVRILLGDTWGAQEGCRQTFDHWHGNHFKAVNNHLAMGAAAGKAECLLQRSSNVWKSAATFDL